MLIRPSTPIDMPALRELFLQSRQAAFNWELASARTLLDFDSETEGERQMVALDGKRLIGFISIWEADDFIHHLHVHPQFLRRGIGRALLHALPGWYTKPYRLKCVSLNNAALAFYRNNGFRPVGSGVADNYEYVLLESGGGDNIVTSRARIQKQGGVESLRESGA
ncbi:ribosomal protein S18 acetylase RimI-like enzyme [Mycoplana sp. BE70]|uniref:GNAT family N-acetyltransferase n=1 Tax=Mycoplana sp. BE70 TaxID=2817775 RepID=UPI00285ADAFC|nr:GNAT family N-acetyltransferase [Mycoplana sp. BE70]MDR6759457.1 ribosomal protein S18 acetylase RimI-like enzyme [Mycoplana sp. BE70]